MVDTIAESNQLDKIANEWIEYSVVNHLISVVNNCNRLQMEMFFYIWLDISHIVMLKACLECSEKIVGREDKKFCSDGCRNAYNNKINKDSNNFMRNVNNRLRRNYRILSTLNADGKTKTSRSKLAGSRPPIKSAPMPIASSSNCGVPWLLRMPLWGKATS